MKLPDANVLIYAVNRDAPAHAEAKAWLDDALSGTETIGFAWIVLLAFLRLSTRPGIFPVPLTVNRATSSVRSWLAEEPSIVVEPSPRHADVLAGLLADVGTGGNLVSDAHLAALALEYDAEIVTYDTDFRRFTGVRSTTP